MMPRGALRLSTMAAGHTLARAGDGYLDPTGRDPVTHLRWWDGLAGRVGASVSGLDSDPDSAGVLWASGNRSFRGMASAAVTSATSTSATRGSQTSTA